MLKMVFPIKTFFKYNFFNSFNLTVTNQRPRPAIIRGSDLELVQSTF